VASFVAQTLLAEGRLFAQAIRPMDYVRTGKRTDVVVVVSYSGSTPDAASVIERARQLGAGRIVLLCSPANPVLGNLLRADHPDVVLSYGNPRRPNERERGFVSIAGTVAPCVLFAAAVRPTSALSELAADLPRSVAEDSVAARQLSTAVASDVPIALFGGGSAWPAMHDLESKWVEGDLGPISIHEVKDFSHGRFLSVLGDDSVHQPLLLAVGGLTEYERLLIDVLRPLSPARLISSGSGTIGALELLIRSQFLAERAARELNRDISRPEYVPEAGLRLYRWKQEASPRMSSVDDRFNGE
jgi:hypothetical protein